MEPQRVQAIYNFTGEHTDELNFKKGDIITITQPLEGGWFEGTLRGVTGWFPANYVIDYWGNAGVEPAIEAQAAEAAEHRATLLANIIKTEAAFVRDLDAFMNSTLQSVWRLFGVEYDLINRHLELILEAHRTLLSGLRAEASRHPNKVGKVFLAIFPRLQSVHRNYCALHPRVIKLIMNSSAITNASLNGATSNNNNNNVPNMLKLSVGLSAPFKRMEKYETVLEELTRLTAENHPDRGDCQRSCSLFRELVQEIVALRRRKDVETEMLNANIRNWDGAPISNLGEVRLTCPVTAQWQNGRKDHYLVVFDSAVILVSLYNPNEFQLDCKFPLEQTTVTKMDKHLSLEFAYQNTRVLVTFHSPEDLEKLRSRVDVYATVQKRNSSKSVDGGLSLVPTVSRSGANGSRPGTPDQMLDVNISQQMTAWPCQQSSRVSRPTSPAWPRPPSQRSHQQQNQQCGSPLDTASGHSELPASRMSLMVSRIRGVLPHTRIKVPLQKEAVPGLKRGSSARKNKKELPTPILPPEPPFNTVDYERDLQILKVVESVANLSKKPTPSIPVGSLAAAGATSAGGLSSLPSVRISTVTAHSGSPMDGDGVHGAVGPGRPLSISPVSPGGTDGHAASIRNVQNDIAFLKEQVAKLQAELQEERRQRRALQDQVNLFSSVKRM
ncbi:rho guanine nucleotide exchange factor 7-like [Varroa jacobsoni]|uniref:rho guanine nucleotide exchange factor 7-like n=1 Tax=Varroa jacobsoni TaxID=62625 RepID=UPI000BF858A9|nr:rho guanine nucleotide exchange factor 7-like [Varroa jacobsoni]XP_022685934.1 rho guanine nucleotide exchange factor 7-like [Varroa jacobsoni]XP_022685935.1 rho guanine nucleotide exchange factor 7-like [Varroa jacobsoni]